MKKSIIYCSVFLAALLTGCTGKVDTVPMLFPYEETASSISEPDVIYELFYDEIEPDISELTWLSEEYTVPLSSDLQVGKENTDISAKAAFLFNLTDNEVIFAKNCYSSIYPASTTKLLTALMTMKYADMDTIVTVSKDNAGITKYGAQLCGFKKGDQVSVRTLLNALLVYSGNDAAVLLAEAVSGDVDSFMKSAMEEAKALGAVNTNFVNPHGLHEDEHKTTAYDLYLIMRECLKYPEFSEIIAQSFYVAEYYSAVPVNAEETADETTETEASTNETGKAELPLEATNQYHAGKVEAPTGIKVLGGKTGSTGAAGDCLIIASSYNDKLYLSAVFGASSKIVLYEQMNKLLEMELSEN